MGTDYDVIFHDGLPLYRQEKMQGPHLQKVLYGYVEMTLRTSLSYWLIMSRGLPTVFYKIERDTKSLNDDERYQIRQRKAVPVWREFIAWVQKVADMGIGHARLEML